VPVPSRSTLALIFVSLVERSMVACRFTGLASLAGPVPRLYQLDRAVSIAGSARRPPCTQRFDLDRRAADADIRSH
jgi:hypothetical protein